jgi:hypothetical protein
MKTSLENAFIEVSLPFVGCPKSSFSRLFMMHMVTMYEVALCRNPTLGECEDETHVPKVGT